MLSIAAFIAFWVILGVGLLFVGVRGGPRGARETWHAQSRRARKIATVAFVLVYLALGAVVPAVLLVGDRDQATANVPGGLKLTPAQAHGQELFGQTCGVCHTLAAARTVGKVGPNFDELRPPVALVLDALAHGRQRGNGTMPQGLLQGRDARDVAEYIHAVAGR